MHKVEIFISLCASIIFISLIYVWAWLNHIWPGGVPWYSGPTFILVGIALGISGLTACLYIAYLFATLGSEGGGQCTK